MKFTVSIQQYVLGIAYQKWKATASVVNRFPLLAMPEDFLQVADFLVAVMNYASTPSETVQTLDDFNVALVRAINDTATFQELVAMSLTTGFGDTARLNDAVALIVSYYRSFGDLFTSADAAAVEFGTAVSEYLLATETPTLAFSTSPNEAIAASEECALGVSSSPVEFVTASDAASKVCVYPRAFDDSAATDDLAPVFGLSRVTDEPVSLVESLGKDSATARTESAIVMDGYLAISFIRSFAETLLASDNFQYVSGGALDRFLSDVALLDDAFSAESSPFASDATATSDDFYIEMDFPRSLDDVISGFLDSAVLSVLTVLNDDINVSDQISTFDVSTVAQDLIYAQELDFQIGFSRPLNDALSGVTDTLSKLAESAAADFLSLADAIVSRSIDAARSESAVASAVGTWVMQSYVDPTYLAEDYVGSSGSFN